MCVEILMHPNDRNTLIAATRDGIWKTTNAAGSWTNKLSGGQFRDMKQKPGSTNTLYAVTATQFFSRISVSGYFLPKLEIEWRDLSITHRHAPIAHTMPTNISISFMEAYYVRKILKEPHYALLHTLDDKGNLALVPLRGSRWEQTSTTDQSSVNPPSHTPNAPPIYPSLPTRVHV